MFQHKRLSTKFDIKKMRKILEWKLQESDLPFVDLAKHDNFVNFRFDQKKTIGICIHIYTYTIYIIHVCTFIIPQDNCLIRKVLVSLVSYAIFTDNVNNTLKCLLKYITGMDVDIHFLLVQIMYIYLWQLPSNSNSNSISLTPVGRVTHVCVSTLTIIGSDNGLSPGRCQTILWTNGVLLIRTSVTNFSEPSAKFIYFHSIKCIWKCRLQNGGHFVSASMCLYHTLTSCVNSADTYTCITLQTHPWCIILACFRLS